jgi:hypothetical protein
VLIDQGEVVKEGDVNAVTEEYMRMGNEIAESNIADEDTSRVIRSQNSCEELRIKSVSIAGDDSGRIRTGQRFTLSIVYERKQRTISPAFVVSVKDFTGLELIRLSTMPISGYEIETLFEAGVVELEIDSLPLVAGSYFIDVGFVRESVEWLLRLENVLKFQVTMYDFYDSGVALDRTRGVMVVDHRWNHRRT